MRWRYDPSQVGVSAQFADCGIHALHLASFVLGQEIERLSADTVSCIASRVLEDDAMVNFRMNGGAVGRLWTSSVAIGRQHGLGIQVFGEKGGLRWSQEQPNQLYWMPLKGRLQVIERGEANLSPEADRTTRVTIGHAEGMPLAFANIYKDLADAISARKEGRAWIRQRICIRARPMGCGPWRPWLRLPKAARPMGNGWTPVRQCSARALSAPAESAPARSPAHPPVRDTGVGWTGGGAGRHRMKRECTRAACGRSSLEVLVTAVV